MSGVIEWALGNVKDGVSCNSSTISAKLFDCKATTVNAISFTDGRAH